MREIGILGGTFNPIHNGHLLMGEAAIRHFSLNEVIFVPSGQSYYKDTDNILDGDLRLEMVKLAIKNNSCFSYNDLELRRKGNTYTYETILELKRNHPDANISFIMGEDSFYSLHQWKNANIIMSNARILVCIRNKDKDKLDAEIRRLENTYNAIVYIIPMEISPISSTLIRKKIYNGDSLTELMPGEVIDFIQRNNLYIEKT